MPGNETGDFELVLGNKQLLSVFFVMVVLLGVFFTMGYIVGRNTAEVEVAATPPEPLVVEAGGGMSEPTQVQAAAEPPPAPTATPTAAETPEPTQVAQAEPPKPPPAAPPATPKPQPAATSTSSAGEPPAGTVYLQVAATTQPEAGLLLEVLEGRGFRGRLAPVPGQDLSRVLIGPLANASEVSETRSALRDAGFEPFQRRY